MAFFWRHRTIITTSTVVQNASLLLSNSSSAAFAASLAPDRVLQPCTALSSDIRCWQWLSIIPVSTLAFEPPLLSMTTTCPKVCRAGSMRHSAVSRKENNSDLTHASRQCVDNFGATPDGKLRSGTEANPAATGPRGASDCGHGACDGTCCSTKPPRRTSPDVQLFCGAAVAVGQAVATSTCAKVNACPSWTTRHDDPPSDESSFGAKVEYLTHDPRETRPDYQGQSRETAKQELALSSGCAQLLIAKSAKRRAAEALLAARFGGVGSAEAKPGRRHLSSSGAALYNYRSTDSASNSPDLPSTSADTSAAAGNVVPTPLSHEVVLPAGILRGMSALRQQADSLAIAAEEKRTQAANAAAKAAAVGSVNERPGLVHAVIASSAVPRQMVQVPGPPTKRARLSLSAAATSNLGAGLSAATVSVAEQPLVRAVKTRVPPCDPARGCKARLQEAVAAAAPLAKGVRSGPSSGPEDGAESGSACASGPVASGPGLGSKSASLESAWCSFEVTLQPINWQPVFDEPAGALQRFSLAGGYEKMLLPQGLVTYVVENEKHIGDALRNLKAGMQDRVVAIDLEWRPETVPGRVSPVALLQVSCASVCLVVRTSCMGYSLPSELRSFLEDPSLVLLGFGWDSADESKMRSTFGIGRADFRHFLDLQEVATSMGYHAFGLSRLSQKVLGIALPKSKSISRSNWAAPQLTNHQLKYASLDVLVAGQLFRALRLWHSSPSPCGDCRSPIGELLLPGPLHCGHPSCDRSSANLQQHRDHCAATGHSPRFAACSTCGRLYELPNTAKKRDA
ncbi:hypothetical protein Vretimale_2624 [Volvox reticuliferus]|uniref:Uncharacterized protein n=1 Tax=Volvox reticuliferus TaxID=1737510 RepID=A0A8J4FGU0_9CHLO|nr:hypothetical protein Vretifemale_1887 [Volvox reticuliferus]GIL96885.1 hypothetical protein Vretimale_2624 [Volvox reticuliferus]